MCLKTNKIYDTLNYTEKILPWFGSGSDKREIFLYLVSVILITCPYWKRRKADYR